MSGRCSRREGRPGRPAWPFLVALMVAVVLPSSACSTPGPSAPTRSAAAITPTRPAEIAVPPGTLAGAQLRWLLTAVAHLPLSGDQLGAHFDVSFLAEVSPDALNQVLLAVSGAELLSIQVSELNTVAAVVSAGPAARSQVWLTVDSRGLISGLRISPVTTGPTLATWADVDADLRSVAPQVRLLAADVSNG